MSHVCSWRHVRTFDNFLRPLIYNPLKVFGDFARPGMSMMDSTAGPGLPPSGWFALWGPMAKFMSRPGPLPKCLTSPPGPD